MNHRTQRGPWLAAAILLIAVGMMFLLQPLVEEWSNRGAKPGAGANWTPNQKKARYFRITARIEGITDAISNVFAYDRLSAKSAFPGMTKDLLPEHRLRHRLNEEILAEIDRLPDALIKRCEERDGLMSQAYVDGSSVSDEDNGPVYLARLKQTLTENVLETLRLEGKRLKAAVGLDAALDQAKAEPKPENEKALIDAWKRAFDAQRDCTELVLAIQKARYILWAKSSAVSGKSPVPTTMQTLRR